MITLHYEAGSAAEFKELVDWLEEKKILSAVTVAPAPRKATPQPSDKGLFELKFLQKSGARKMRLTKDEVAAGLNREGAAQSRLLAMEISAGGVRPDETGEDEDLLPPDDDEELY